jgi:hypothetical protein
LRVIPPLALRLLGNWVAGAHGEPGLFGWRESDSMTAHHRHTDETPTIYSMAIIFEFRGVQCSASVKNSLNLKFRLVYS